MPLDNPKARFDSALPQSEAWAAPLRDLIDARHTREARAGLVRHLAGFSGPRPSQKWRRTCASLAEGAGAVGALAASLHVLATEQAPFGADAYDGGHGHFVHPDHKALACGVVWAAALTSGASAVSDLHRLVLLTGNFKQYVSWDAMLAGATLNALGAVDAPAGLEALSDLDRRIRHKTLRKQFDAAIETAAARQGVTRRQLIERAVPDHGLSPGGTLTREVGEHRVTLAIENATTVRLSYAAPGEQPRRTAPAAIKDAPELGALKSLAKEVRGALTVERRRIEALMSATDAEWPYEEWARHYRDHPLVGVIARALIWEFEDETGEWHAALPGDSPGTPLHALPASDAPAASDDAPTGDVSAVAGDAPIGGGGDASGGGLRVRLWHPVRRTPDEIRAWRTTITDREIRQPFKQAFREIYLLTPAEEATGTYSNRLAGHIVHYNRFYALTKERGWRSNYLGPHYAGAFGEARGTFDDGRWEAVFDHVPATDAFDVAPEHASTDQVRFRRRAGKGWAEAELADVPQVVFSEAMRDADLFVGVTSIAADPDWLDHGDDRFAGYWRTTAFGELTDSARTRRAALERIVPRLKIADRCELHDRYLRVRGDLRTYKIHLGSANILMEPDDSYLCIVQGKSTGAGRVFLPFEDERLSLILSKAALLAADSRIDDTSILAQITRGAR
ncbi:DUF4132 domain-containing protein [Actinomadura rupiterrae]|uniref:DUF4132 domain-containing protein n=1 Tax=Actinomadura rupiterrae TaxID=559627 RepID=UPI0020A4D6EF|nr:DUF4132 domain-containing protein [Actinomadura rupiterrae]MCP2342467.1 hypothetical protein [Actinomadura rupiterrae]